MNRYPHFDFYDAISAHTACTEFVITEAKHITDSSSIVKTSVGPFLCKSDEQDGIIYMTVTAQ